MIAIGNLRIDAPARRVFVDDAQLELEPRQFDVLRVLAEQPNTAAPRDRLLEQAWSGRVVSDAALSQAVSKLRRALEGAGAKGIDIATVHGFGYRLDAPDARRAAPRPTDRPQPASPDADADRGAGPARRMVCRWHLVFGGLLGIVLLFLAFRTAEPPPIVLAIAPFELDAEAAGWGSLGWPSLVEDVLDQRTNLRTLGPRRVQSAAREVTATGDERPAALLARMNELSSVDHLLLVAARQLGDEWVLSYRVAELGGRIARGEIRGRGLRALSEQLSAAVSGELDVAYEAGIPVRTLSDDDFVNEAFARGMQALLSGDAQAATAHFSSALTSDPRLAWARYELANAQQQLGAWEAARDNYLRVAALAEEQGDFNLAGVAASGLGVLDWRAGRLEAAEARFVQALERFRAVGNVANAASALGNLGILADNRQEFGLARERYLQALEGYLAEGERYGESAVYSNLAVLERKLGNLQEAARYQQRAIDIQEAVRLKSMLVFSLAHAGKILVLQGDTAAARGRLEGALALAVEIGDRLNQAEASSALAELDFERGELTAMGERLAPALAIYTDLDNASGRARVRLLEARRALARQDPATAGEAAGEALAIARRLEDRELQVAGLLLLAEADTEAATPRLDQARDIADETGVDALRARVHLARGLLSSDARAELEQAATAAARTSDAALKAEIAARLAQHVLLAEGMDPVLREWRARAVEALPDHPEVLYLEALVRAAAGETRAARAALDRARQRFGERWDASREEDFEALLAPVDGRRI